MQFPLSSENRVLHRIGFAFLVLAIALLTSGCPGGGGSNSSSPANPSVVSCGDGAVDAGEQCDDGNTASGDGCSQTCQIEVVNGPICGNGVVDAGEQCDDGNAVSGDGCSQSCQTEVVGGALAVANVQAVADEREGATLTMSSYTVPADGFLIVRLGAKGSTSISVRFGGVDMVHVTSLEVSYFTTVSVEMFYLPVVSGQSGAIEVDYGFTGTDAKAMIAATLPGVDRLDRVQTYTDGESFSDGRTGPNIAEGFYSVSNASVILSVLTDHGRGIPAESGLGHLLDSHPTVPESAFHESKVLAGHVLASQPGSHTLGYRNTDPLGHMDYVMIIASFSSGG